jgi:predicted MPP superfamily phosphohydrolase
LGIWGVLGNHEFHTVGKDNSTFFEAAGIHLLRNAWVALRPGLVIAGVDDAAATDRGGVGTWGPRMRLWKPAEIIRITLRSDGRHQQRQ